MTHDLIFGLHVNQLIYSNIDVWTIEDWGGIIRTEDTGHLKKKVDQKLSNEEIFSRGTFLVIVVLGIDKVTNWIINF